MMNISDLSVAGKIIFHENALYINQVSNSESSSFLSFLDVGFRIVNPKSPHPLRQEFLKGGSFDLENCYKKTLTHLHSSLKHDKMMSLATEFLPMPSTFSGKKPFVLKNKYMISRRL